MSEYTPTTDTVRATYVRHHGKCEPCGDEREALVAEFERWLVAHDRDVVAELADEVERLRRWKDEAAEVLIGMQDLGRELNVPLGQRITGEGAAEAARAIVDERDRLAATVERVRELSMQVAHDPDVEGMTLRDMGAIDHALAVLAALEGPDAGEVGRDE